jgi:iron complex outermembrane receptor protein
LGTKGRFADGRIELDAAVVYIDWQDVQSPITILVPPNNTPAASVINGESASGAGADLSVSLRPLDRLTMGFSVGWNDLTMDSDLLTRGLVLFRKGERLNLSSEMTAGASIDYDLPLGASGITGRFSASANYASARSYRALVGTTISVKEGDPILIARTSLAVEWPSRWAASLYVENLNNEEGSPARQPFAPAVTDWDTRVRPRTIGMQLEYRY